MEENGRCAIKKECNLGVEEIILALYEGILKD